MGRLLASAGDVPRRGRAVATQVGVASSDGGTSGRFTWRVHNFPLFRDMIKAQKIMSPVFTAGECSLRLSVYQSSVGAVDYMSMWCGP